jgi:hypothetical protein
MNTMTTMAASSLQQDDIPLGAHLVTPRRGYMHHGIYVGGGEVVHYMGLSTTPRRGPVAKVTLARFASGHAVSIEREATASYTPLEIVARAQSRLGEDRYSVLSNNCEHLCSWCAHGVARSSQVDRLLAWPKRMARALLSALQSPAEAALAQTA